MMELIISVVPLIKNKLNSRKAGVSLFLCYPLKAQLTLFTHAPLNIENHTLLSWRHACLPVVCTTLDTMKLSIHVIKSYSESATEDTGALWSVSTLPVHSKKPFLHSLCLLPMLPWLWEHQPLPHCSAWLPQAVRLKALPLLIHPTMHKETQKHPLLCGFRASFQAPLDCFTAENI